MSAAVKPQTHYRKDYTAPDYFIRHIDLKVTIGETATRVDAQLQIERNPERPAGQALRLDGEAMELLALAIDGAALDAADYELVDGGLLIATVPERFRLDSTVMIDPDNNTALEGLYRSDNILCTQCEAEGFRHITYFMDRPDIMASYRTTIVADKKRYPVLLSNGNPVDRGEQGDQHWISREDPYPKPCYLFALVAGDLACVEDHYTTASGRKVTLQIYVDHGNEHRCGHALTSLKAAMAWDEQTYGLEYDLDVYMIVAVAAFNMGAMENKGLNLFNDRFILADPETATDDDYVHVRDVIGHEYFHNWTGNRVTLRDWFQLSLKESLTVFREQSFSADQGMAAVNRISSVRQLRRVQFPEDAGPLAHPVRPESYIEMNNFYTATVYEKGAEVIRMLHTLLGDAVFRQAVRDYLQRFDGQAVTIEDFIATFEQASGRDLQQFRLWYSQAGTPVIDVTEDYADGVYSLTFRQQLPATPGQHHKQPMLVPMRLGLLDPAGKPLPLQMETTAQVRYENDFEAVVELREETTSVRFSGIDKTKSAAAPTASLLRGFSAPVKINAPHTEPQLHFLVRHDVDPYCRCEAGQQLLLQAVLNAVEQIQAVKPVQFQATLAPTFATLLELPITDPALVAEMLMLPGQSYIAEQLQIIQPLGIVEAHASLHRYMATALHENWNNIISALTPVAGYEFTSAAAGRRRLHGLALTYLADADAEQLTEICKTQFARADNMTDSLAALTAINNVPGAARDELFAAFEQHWHDNPLVLDKWFRLQAIARRTNALEEVAALMQHPAFTLRNPNRVRALLGAFTVDNMAGLHRADGAGYAFIADRVLELDRLNGQVAARLASCLTRWRRYAEQHAEMMHAELERILAAGNLSTNLYEVVSKSLAED